MIAGLVQKAVTRSGSNVEGRDADEILKELASRRGPERILDFMLRTGPYGDGFGADPDGLTLAQLEANPHGIDFGPLQPRIPEVLRTPTGKIELAPQICLDDVARLRAALDAPRPELVLVGRRDLRSNNSWMHNLPVLVKGKDRCTLQVHPDDAAHAGVADGASRARCGRPPARSSSRSRSPTRCGPASSSLPHGWGHDRPGTRLQRRRVHGRARTATCSPAPTSSTRSPATPSSTASPSSSNPSNPRTGVAGAAGSAEHAGSRISGLRRGGPW